MRRGAWVLLDELNLASQTVLEGLNAVLDHRAEVRAVPRERLPTVLVPADPLKTPCENVSPSYALSQMLPHIST